MPTFPYDPEDCPEGIRISCGRKALQTYLQENTYYPTEALNAGIEGIAVITFIVEPDGVITNAKIIRDPGEGTGEEALRVVTQMSEMERRWFPGTQRGRAVRVQYNLPVKFKIGLTKEAPGASRDSIYIVVDTAPLFPRSQSGCEKTPIECSTGTMLNYVYNQVNYPEEAVAQGVYGMSVVKFVVEKDGTMSDLTLARDPGAGTGDEALRVVKTIVDNNLLWTPGEIEGEPVRTRFALPIKFSLSKRQIKEAKKRAKQANRN
jgi:TonB family protein